MSSLFLSRYFPVLEKSFMTGYMLMGEGCPLSGKRCCLTVPLRPRLQQQVSSHMASDLIKPLLYPLRPRLRQPAGSYMASDLIKPLLYSLRPRLQQPASSHNASALIQPLLYYLRPRLQQPVSHSTACASCRLFVTLALAQRRPHSYDDY